MILQNAIRRIPRAVDQDPGITLAQHWGAGGDMAQVLRGIGGTSPYLNAVFTSQRDWLVEAFATKDALTHLMADTTRADDLRQAKKRAAGYLAYAELTGAARLMDTTRGLTAFADHAVEVALRDALDRSRDTTVQDARVFALAMGKMGAGELNYSSDIDLIFMFDDTDMDGADTARMRSALVKVVRMAVQTLSQVTDAGYVFRTDLRLRPDPSVTPVCIGTRSALGYYESLGRTWERAAFIKARVCAGDMAAGNRFLDALVPFVWRRHLDFAAIEEAHSLRLKIREQKRLPPRITLPGHDMKLGRGGIREIEFFTQTRQLIAGGRDPGLRTRETLVGLDVLAAADWIAPDRADRLKANYTSHRLTEHCLQMLRDAQTQSLPTSAENMDRVAALQGLSLAEFKDKTQATLEETHAIVEEFFDPAPRKPAPDAARWEPGDQDEAILSGWPALPALRSERAAQIFETLRPQLLDGLSKAADPPSALREFDAFLRGLPSGVQLFSLFAANPKLVELLTSIAARAPALARYLGRHPSVLDTVLDGDFFDPITDRADLTGDLAGLLAGCDDFETGLNQTRIWMKELHFRIGVHLLQGTRTPAQTRGDYSALARAVLGALVPFVMAQFEAKHGRLPDQRFTVIGMGSLGAGRLGAGSDLDLMVLFDADLSGSSDGKRPLSARQYFARLTQQIITALTAPTAEGKLYEVDMRLRPSGKAGPVAVHLDAFEAYQMNEAWVWEHLALTQARPVFSTGGMDADFGKVQRRVLDAKGDRATVMDGLRDMRGRLLAAKPQDGAWDMKNGPGGLQDLELYAQAIALMAGQSLPADPQFQGVGLAQLAQAHGAMSDLRTCHGVLCVDSTRIWPIGTGGWAVIKRHCHVVDEDQLTERTMKWRQDAIDILQAEVGV